LGRAGRQLGAVDDLGLGLGAVAVLAERYLLRDERGKVSESAGQMMDRAAVWVAQAEEAWRPGSAGRWTEEFAGAMRRLEFLPNSPTLMNAGTRLGLLSGCVVLPLRIRWRRSSRRWGRLPSCTRPAAAPGIRLPGCVPAGTWWPAPGERRAARCHS
jgi:ribonucleoside-diphosphate reductase alpha chain